MARVIFKKGSAASLPKTYSEGTLYITTDERAIYLDISDSARVRIGMSDADIESKISALTEKKIDDAITELDLDNTFDPKGAADSKDEAIAAAKQAGDDAQADVDALTEKVGDVEEGKTVVEMIADAQTAATYDDTEITERVSANESALAIDSAPAAYDTLKEISNWISGHAGDAAEMNSDIAENTEAIAKLKALIGSLPEGTDVDTVIAYIDKAVNGAKEYADTLALEWGTF